jgi:hypothetical protein
MPRHFPNPVEYLEMTFGPYMQGGRECLANSKKVASQNRVMLGLCPSCQRDHWQGRIALSEVRDKLTIFRVQDRAVHPLLSSFHLVPSMIKGLTRWYNNRSRRLYCYASRRRHGCRQCHGHDWYNCCDRMCMNLVLGWVRERTGSKYTH